MGNDNSDYPKVLLKSIYFVFRPKIKAKINMSCTVTQLMTGAYVLNDLLPSKFSVGLLSAVDAFFGPLKGVPGSLIMTRLLYGASEDASTFCMAFFIFPFLSHLFELVIETLKPIIFYFCDNGSSPKLHALESGTSI